MEQRLRWPDLSPRDTSLEWWFVQGYLEGERTARRNFMLSLFRQRCGHDGGNAHMLLLSTLEAGTGRHHVRSQVSPELVRHFLESAPPELKKSGIEDRVIDAFVKEIGESGPPAPIRVEPGPATILSAPFEAMWGDISLTQLGDSFEIGFTPPGDARRCLLKAQSHAAWLTEESVGGENSVGTMAYHSCPRLALIGSFGEAAVRGEAWVDHQWGDYGWLRGSDAGGRLFGWDWFGINLSDATDLMVMVHRDMRSGSALSSFAVVFAPGRRPSIVRDVAIRAARRWLSPHTMVDYPIAWEIEIPSISARLRFEPAADDQEIPVFGFINAVWEGAGSITGEFGGKKVSGRGRLELHGYGYIHDFKLFQNRWTEKIDRNIRAFLPERLDQAHLAAFLGPPRWRYDEAAQSEMLAAPIWDLLSRGGKHWRPIFGYLLLQALGVDPKPFDTMLSVIPELIHNASVVIDDIEDVSQTRRGDATVHLKYGLPTAINMANTLYFLPLLSISNHPHLGTEKREAIYRIIIEMFVQAHFGQAQDLYWSKLARSERAAVWGDEGIGDLILQAHAFKTAAAVRATAEIACVIAGADSETTRACTRFGESWGVAFQIVDDVNNFTRTPEWGKVRGEDVTAGKFTFALHKAVGLLAGAEKRRLMEILACEETRRSDAGLREAIGLVEASGALEACRRHARELMEADWPVFSRALPASRHKLMLRILLDKLIDLPVET